MEGVETTRPGLLGECRRPFDDGAGQADDLDRGPGLHERRSGIIEARPGEKASEIPPNLDVRVAA